MKAIIHIGTEKTGTTSIQNFLYQNRRKLRANGFHFVQSPGKLNNQALPAICIRNDKMDDFFRQRGIETTEQRDAYRREFTAEFEAELQGLPASVHTVLISSEHFHSRIRTEEEMDNVHAFLSRYFDDIKIVCYLREQGVTCSSYYSTSLKSGGPISFEDFMLRCAPSNYYFNYLDMLANWERCFGFDALDVSLFSRQHWERGDLLEDFAKKIDPKLVGKLNTSIQTENESLSPAGQALMRAVNMVFPGRTARAEVDPVRDKCRKLIYDNLRGHGQRLQLSSHLHVFDSFRESNEALRQKFFPDIEVIFPEPTEASGVDTQLPDVFVDVLTGVLNVLRKDGKGIVTPEEITEFLTSLGRSINEIANPGGPDMDEATEVALTRQDARILKRAAQGYEKRNPELAYQLLSLCEKADTTLPGIHNKLEQYQREREQPSKQQYFLRSIVDRQSPDWVPDKLNHDLLYGWYASFQHQIVGAMMNRLDDLNTIGDDTAYGEIDFAVDCFTIIEADSREEAEEIASRCPLLQVGGAVEVSALTFVAPGLQSAVK